MGEFDFEREVLAALSDIRERVARMEATQAVQCDGYARRLDNLEADVSVLQEHRSYSRGQQAALTAAGTVIGSAAGAVAAHFLGGK